VFHGPSYAGGATREIPSAYSRSVAFDRIADEPRTPQPAAHREAIVTTATLAGHEDLTQPLDAIDVTELLRMADVFKGLWRERAKAPPKLDLISMMAHSEHTCEMPEMEFVGNLALLIVGGNDTTRNSMSGGLLALSENPGELAKLKANPALVPSLVAEMIRYQTPVIHMRRTATCDTELAGQHIRQGDKVVMWYISGNRDETAIDNPDAFIVDRLPRQDRRCSLQTRYPRSHVFSIRLRLGPPSSRRRHRSSAPLGLPTADDRPVRCGNSRDVSFQWLLRADRFDLSWLRCGLQRHRVRLSALSGVAVS